MAAVGEADIKEKLLKGHKAAGRDCKVHLDGFNLLPMLTGKTDKSPRESFIYVSDDGEILAIRKGDWKAVFAEQRAAGFAVWRDPFIKLRGPKLFHLRRDPFERADTDSNSYNTWWGKRVFRIWGMVDVATKGIATLKDFPPRQKPGSFNLDQIMADLQEGSARNN